LRRFFAGAIVASAFLHDAEGLFMRGDPNAGRQLVGTDPAGSARRASGVRTSPIARVRRWRRLDMANGAGIVFGLSCLLWLPAQAAFAAVVTPTHDVVPAEASPAPLIASVAVDRAVAPGEATPPPGAADGEVAGSTTATSPPDATSRPEPTPRIAGDSKPVPAAPAVVKRPTTTQPITANPTPQPAPVPAVAPATYSRDLYNGSLFRNQDPDGTACTAAATEDMLNLIRSRGTTGSGFVWNATTSYQTQEMILAWERANDTLDAGAPGSDPHGWRNALNHFGWNSYTTFGARPYEDLSYSSFAAATKAAVIAIARENRPVGILAWSGGHAQMMTGYEVYGQDPATSTDFDIIAVYLSDPLAKSALLDARVTYANFRSGPTLYRFTAYNWTDSAADDPYMPGTKASYMEWYGKWVIIAPVSFEAALPGAH
jgi:hypothetical protein